jgi:hypothetical protein
MNQRGPDSPPRLKAKQGQYLAFIHAYRRLLGRSPAEADMQRFFQVTPPSVHQMVLSLEKAGLIKRQPGIARSITLALDSADLPELVSRMINRKRSLDPTGRPRPAARWERGRFVLLSGAAWAWVVARL